MKIHGFFSPLLVFRASTQSGKDEFTLLAGRDRLRAAIVVGLEKLPCMVVESASTNASMISIAENIFRKEVPALDKAEMLCVWLQFAPTKIVISRQHVAKFHGRPKATINYAIDHFSHYGRSVAARRKEARRAQKINALPADVKAAAREANLHSNQRALLDIAKTSGLRAKLRLIGELAEANRTPSNNVKSEAAGTKGAGHSRRLQLTSMTSMTTILH